MRSPVVCPSKGAETRHALRNNRLLQVADITGSFSSASPSATNMFRTISLVAAGNSWLGREAVLMAVVMRRTTLFLSLFAMGLSLGSCVAQTTGFHNAPASAAGEKNPLEGQASAIEA